MRTRPKTWNSRTNERTRSSMTRSMCPRGIGRLLEGKNEKREDIDFDKDLDDEVLDVEDLIVEVLIVKVYVLAFFVLVLK